MSERPNVPTRVRSAPISRAQMLKLLGGTFLASTLVGGGVYTRLGTRSLAYIVNSTPHYPKWETKIAQLDGVDVFSNGADHKNGVGGTYGFKYQCVELVQRYFFLQKWGTPKKWGGNAYVLFDRANQRLIPEVKAINNGTSPGPRRGDALVFHRSRRFPYGHVAIVTDIFDRRVYFAEQNWITRQATWGQGSLSIDGTNTIAPRVTPSDTTLPVRGWLHAVRNTGLPQSSAFLGLEITIPGISNVGYENNNPLHTRRLVTIQLYDKFDHVVLERNAFSTYDNTTGTFKSLLDLGTLASGQYKVKVWMPYTLRKCIPGPHNSLYNVFGKGVTTYLQVGMHSVEGGGLIRGFPLISGDLDQNNQLNSLDYNIIMNAYDTKQGDPKYNAAADLNDNGTVKQGDYNIWLRNIQSGGQGD